LHDLRGGAADVKSGGLVFGAFSAAVVKQFTVPIDDAVVLFALDLGGRAESALDYDADEFIPIVVGSGFFLELEVIGLVLVAPLGGNPNPLPFVALPLVTVIVGLHHHLLHALSVGGDIKSYPIVARALLTDVLLLIVVDPPLLKVGSRELGKGNAEQKEEGDFSHLILFNN
jgi:hypothetical protein